MQGALARSGARSPVARAAEACPACARVAVGATAARRHTAQAAAADVAVRAAEAERPGAAARAAAGRQASVGGAFVPRLHGAWAEVKTPAAGEVVLRPDPDDPPPPST